jgi:hypothetical protein
MDSEYYDLFADVSMLPVSSATLALMRATRFSMAIPC